MPNTLRTTGWQPTHREDPEGAGWRKTATIGNVGGNVDPKRPHDVPPHAAGGGGGVATVFSRTDPAKKPSNNSVFEGWVSPNTHQHAPGWSPSSTPIPPQVGAGGDARSRPGAGYSSSLGGGSWDRRFGAALQRKYDLMERGQDITADTDTRGQNVTMRGQDLLQAQHGDKMSLDWDKHGVQQDQWGKQHRLDWAEAGSTASKNKALSNYYDVMGQIGQSAERRLAASQEFDQQQTRDAPINAMLQTMLTEGMFPGSKKVNSEQAGQLSKVFADLMKGGYNQDTPLAEIGDRMEEIFESAQELFGHPGAGPQGSPTIEMPELLEILTAEDGRSKIEMLRKHMETRAQQQKEQQAQNMPSPRIESWGSGGAEIQSGLGVDRDMWQSRAQANKSLQSAPLRDRITIESDAAKRDRASKREQQRRMREMFEQQHGSSWD